MRSGERAAGAARSLQVVEHDPIPDSVLPVSEREELKQIVRSFEATHSEHALMYLSCAFEDAARRKAGR